MIQILYIVPQKLLLNGMLLLLLDDINEYIMLEDEVYDVSQTSVAPLRLRDGPSTCFKVLSNTTEDSPKLISNIQSIWNYIFE